MKICALFLTAVVVLDSVDRSLQGNRNSARPSSPPAPPPRRRPSPPKTIFPYLPKGSLIIQNFEFPENFYYKLDKENHFRELFLKCDAVVNYERKIVAIFPLSADHELHGIYYGREGPRIKLNPACLKEEHIGLHIDELDNAGYHYYPEFVHFEKPDEIIVDSLQAYKSRGRGLSCAHTLHARRLYSYLPPEAHIVRGVQFPQGFFFKIDQQGLFHPLSHHNCDVVVDPSGMIVAVFLGPAEYKLFGIYRGEGGKRVKFTHISMDAQHFELNDREESELYLEFAPYHKPPEIIRESFAASG